MLKITISGCPSGLTRLSNNMWSAREKAFMIAAVTIAHNSTQPCRHGAIIARRKELISTGWNKDKTHPAAVHYFSKCIHAELAALISANKEDLIGNDIYVARVMRSPGEPLGMSRPCPQCMKMLINAGIKKAYYTNRTGSWSMEKL